MANNFSTIAMIAAPLIGIFALLKTAIFAHNVVQALQTLGLTASLAPIGAFALGMLKVTLPILAVVAAGYALYKVFQYVSDKVKGAGWTFSDAIEAIKDNLKGLLLTLGDGFLWLLDKLTFGDAKKKIKQAQEAMKAEREELKEREKARDDRRKTQGEEYQQAKAAAEQKKKEEEASQKLTESKKQEQVASAAVTETKKEESKPAPVPIDMSTPQKMFDSLKKRMTGQAQGQTQPGTTATSPVTGAGTPPPLNQDQAKNMDLIKAALQKQGITDPKYIAATLGNVMKETGGKSINENLNYGNTSNERIRSIFGSRASGKSDAELNEIKKDPQKMGEMMYGSGTKLGQQMGNTEPGDGFKYRGRGFIQLTGKNNYAAASKEIYGDNRLVENPDLVNQPDIAAQVTAWYMKKGQKRMAAQMGIDTNNMTQEQANMLATSQVAGKAVKPGQGYLGGEVLSKVNTYAAQFATPSATAAAAAVTPGNQTTQTSTVAAEQERMRQEGRSVSGPSAPAGTQETSATLLSQLNTKMDQLIAITKRVNDVNERQLSVQRNIAQSGDLYVAA